MGGGSGRGAIMHTTEYMLSVDLGVKTGLALYSSEPRLIWYRSQNYGNKSRLKSDIYNILNHNPGIRHLIVEGGGDLAKLWLSEANKRNITCRQIYAEDWRKDLFNQYQVKDGLKAKQSALKAVNDIIRKMHGPKPTSMVHDAAEAILIGYWGIGKLGWVL